MKNKGLQILRFILVISVGLTATGVYDFVNHLPGGRLMARVGEIAQAIGVIGVLAGVVLLALTWTSYRGSLLRLIETAARKLAHAGSLNLALLLVGYAAWLLLMLGKYGRYFTGSSVRLAIFWLVSLFGCLLLKAWNLNQASRFQGRWREFLALALLLAAFSYRMAAFLPDISAYPFTLTWSETSRYYYASLFLSERIYGAPAPPTVLHPSRYLLQAIPFLLSNTPLWLHRAWQVCLWISATCLTAYLLTRRLRLSDVPTQADLTEAQDSRPSPPQPRRWRGDWLQPLLTFLWLALFILIGPIYYHLLVPVIIILAGFDTRPNQLLSRRALSWISLLVASAWAGISRVNWFPVPAMLAASLYLLEQPAFPRADGIDEGGRGEAENIVKGEKRFGKKIIRYLAPVFAWGVIGTGVAFGAQALYILCSGNQAREFTTSFASDLLWYRLWPNPTFPMGLLPGILYVSLPIILLVILQLANARDAQQSYHPLRLLGLMAMLGVLFAGGLVVSVKIGGGSNLHNFDAYLMLLALVSTYLYYGKAPEDVELTVGQAKRKNQVNFHPGRRDSFHKWLPGLLKSLGLVMTLLVAIWFTIPAGGSAGDLPGADQVKTDLNILTRFARDALNNGDILFISNRHLLTFNYLPGIPLVPEYERVFLMEMAMANNPDYLGRFYQDLQEQRFGLIVTEPLFNQIKDERSAFGAENNAWVRRVSNPILCYYKPARTLKKTRIQLLLPRPAPKSDCSVVEEGETTTEPLQAPPVEP